MENGHEIKVLDNSHAQYVRGHSGEIELRLKLPIFVKNQYSAIQANQENEDQARFLKIPNEFYIPKLWRMEGQVEGQEVPESNLNHEFYSEEAEKFNDDAYDIYDNMVNAGIELEMAKMFLPLSIYVEVDFSWSAEEVLNFIKLKNSPLASFEIKEYAKAVEKIYKELAFD